MTASVAIVESSARAPVGNQPLRVLGLDPGSRVTGWGCVDVVGSRALLLGCGCIEPPGAAALPRRLAQLAAELVALVERWQPAVAVLEEPFHGVNARSLIVLAQARGALLATLAGRDIAIEEFSPAEVKSAVTGSGRAGKDQVARMVAMLLPGAGLVAPDAADALAVALCFAAHRPLARAAAMAGRS
jgi:crossover junction endodeoxyribonuclease RuvC